MRENRIIALSDIKKVYAKNKKHLWRNVFIIACISFVFPFLQSVKYDVRAVFKDVQSNVETPSKLKEVLLGGGGSPQSEALDIMNSRFFLAKLVKSLGLQMQVKLNSSSLVARAFGRIKDNLYSFWGVKLKDRPAVYFADVFYEGLEPRSFTICFKEGNLFQLYNEKGDLVAEQSVGSRVILENLSFTLESFDKEVAIGKKYPLAILPMREAVENTIGLVGISPDKNNSSLLILRSLYRDRNFSARLINGMMKEYQNYLKEEHNRVAERQLDYLENRKNSLFNKLKHDFELHADFLTENFGVHGFFDFNQAVQALSVPSQDYTRQKEALKLEEAKLLQANYNKQLPLVDGVQVEQIRYLKSEIEQLESEKALLDLSLEFQEGFSAVFTEEVHESSFFKKKKENIEEVRAQISQLQDVLSRKNEEISFEVLLSEGPLKLAKSSFSEMPVSNLSQEEIGAYLKDSLKLLQVKEEILQKRLLSNAEIPIEQESFDLSTAKQIFLSYNEMLDRSHEKMTHYQFIRKQLKDPSFEATSLGAVLVDSLSQFHLKKIADYTFSLHDDKHVSAKEQERAQKEIALHKQCLDSHLKELIVIEKLDSSLFKRHITNMQQLIRDRVHQKLLVLQEQVQSLLERRKRDIALEKDILDSRLNELQDEMKTMPAKWYHEKILQYKASMSLKLMESIANVVEAKTINHHLHSIESRPLDLAYLPDMPNTPKAFLFAFAGGVLGFIGIFLKKVIQALIQGFPLSQETLLAYGKCCLGTLSGFCDGKEVEFIPDEDLEAFRKMSLLVDENTKVVSLICSKGPNYSHTLAELLSFSGKKVLLVQAIFDARFTEQDLPGLLGYLQKETDKIPVKKGEVYDLIPSGGTSRFSTELLGSSRFTKLLEECKKKYDVIMISSRVQPVSVEAKILASISDSTVVTIRSETIDDIDRAFTDERLASKINFVTA